MLDVSRSLRRGRGRGVDVNMAPLVDMVFLLLIFFAVTTSFVREAGIDVQRSTAATAELKERGNILIGVTADGRVYWESKPIDLRSVRAHVERALAEDPESGVVVVADRLSQTWIVVGVMDQCRLAGAANVSLAARRADEGAG